MNTNDESFIALHRYFIWAEKMREQALAFGPPPADPEASFEWALGYSAFVSYWFSSVQVVIEGWEQLALSDSRINDLLKNAKNRQILRRFRNGVFHYQPKYVDRRIQDFIVRTREIIPWVNELHSEICRFFLDTLGKTWRTIGKDED